MALRLELLADQHADRHRAGVVDLRDLHGLALVLPQLLGVAEQAEGDDADVDVAVGERLVDDARVGLEVGGVEVDDAHVGSTGGAHLSLGGLAARVTGKRRQGDLGGALLQEGGGNGEADLAGAAEHQDGLGDAHGVDHVRCSLVVAGWPGGRPSQSGMCFATPTGNRIDSGIEGV